MRLIDAHDLWTEIMMLPHNGDMISSEEVEKAIVEAPTVDAVPVVRCKDCIYQNKLKVTGGVLCDHKKGLMSTKLKDDDFCPYGERRVSDV